MAEMFDGIEDLRTGKQVGELDYGANDIEPVLERQPFWGRIGDMEGWIDPRGDGSFELRPVDRTDQRFTEDSDYGPKDASVTPDEIPMQVWDWPGDDANEADGWSDAIYRPKRS